MLRAWSSDRPRPSRPRRRPSIRTRFGASTTGSARCGFEALAVEAIREQQSSIAALQARNGELQQALQMLAERLAALEAAKEQ